MSVSPATHLWLPLVLLVSCAELTAPTTERSGGKRQPATTAAEPKPERRAPAQKDAARARPKTPNAERVAASHVLIAYQNARRSRATRSKDEARKLAEQVARQAKGGGDFAKLAAQHSDDVGSKARGGSLGSFERRRMVKPFADAAFALKPGQVSGVVETPFGFHIIKRTQ